MKKYRMLTAMLVCLSILFSSKFVYAIPVEFEHPSWYELSGDLVFEQVGLEWMRWDITNGLSIRQAVDIYSPHGWRLATNHEMAGLMNHWEFHIVSGFEDHELFHHDENTVQERWDPATHANLSSFEDLFGLTSYYCNEDEPLMLDLYGCWSHSAAFFGADGDGDDLYNIVDLSFVHWPDNSWSTALLDSDKYHPDFAKGTIDWKSYASGVALVRDISPIPVPSSLPLFLSTLLAFHLVRRLRRKRH